MIHVVGLNVYVAHNHFAEHRDTHDPYVNMKIDWFRCCVQIFTINQTSKEADFQILIRNMNIHC